jgi:hypothetical protein
VDADLHVDAAVVSRRHEWLARHGLVKRTWKVGVELAPVDLDATAARQQDHAGDRALSFPRRREAGIALELDGGRLARGGLLRPRLSRRLGLAARPLLRLGLAARLLLGAQLALGLDRDRLELGARRLVWTRGGLFPAGFLGRLAGLPAGFLRRLGGLLCARLILRRLGALLPLRFAGGRLGALLGSLVGALVVGHQATSISLGCCAWWGWSGPA